MKVINIESEAFQELLKKIRNIEQYVKRTSDLFCELDETLELSSRDIMDTLGISKTTLYRWRDKHIIPFRFDERGNALYPYKDLIIAVKNGTITMPKTNKTEILCMLSDFKEKVIVGSLWHTKPNNNTV